MEKVIVSFHLDKEIIKILKLQAKKEDVSVSHLVNKFLKEKLKREK